MIPLSMVLTTPLLQRVAEENNSNVRDAATEALDKREEFSTGR